MEKEYQLGQAWVRSLRGQTTLLSDPATSYYLEQLVWNLASKSNLSDHRLEILSIQSQQFNAFAAPGGIIGLNSGLILAAKTEGELASVIAHEIAHLSQRHFAAQIEQQRQNRPLFIASVLAGLVASSISTSTGTAALSSALALNQANSLSFSRQREHEADRIGMRTLVAAGYNPSAMPSMFNHLLASSRFSTRPPEFLTTHPVTESRIADSENRARQLKQQGHISPANTDLFALIKPRISILHHRDIGSLRAQLQHQISDATLTTSERQQLNYELFTLACFTGNKRLSDQHFSQLNKKTKDHWLTHLSLAELDINIENYSAAVTKLKKLSLLYPENYPVHLRLAQSYQHAGNIKAAIKTYRALSQHRPTDSQVKYELSEAYGLANNLTGVHRSRIEYFLLTGSIDAAFKQLNFAKKESRIPKNDKAQFETLETEAKRIRQLMNTDF